MEASQKIDRGTKLAIAAMGVAVLVIANDFSAINVALPAIEEDFDTSVTTVQWVVNAYALTFGVLIVTGGRLADLFGRRSMFFLGTAIFAFFSLLGGFAPTEDVLIACRVLMGVGGALMWPAILGMTFAALPADRAGLAGGLILGAAGLGNAIGPLIGGVLTDLLSWRWIFFANVPISALAVLITWMYIHQPSTAEEDSKMDYAGVATISIGLVSLLIAFDQVAQWGWGDPRILALLALTITMLISFVFIERRAGAHALVPRDVMSNRSFSASCAAILFMSATFFAAMLYLPQFMEKELGFTAIQAGLGMLPMMATFALTSFVAGPLYNRVGPKLLVSLGAACIALGPFLLSLAVHRATFAAIVPGMAVLGLGIGLFYPTATTAGVTAVSENRTSLAGGIVYMFQIAGGSIGLGLTTTIFARNGGEVPGPDDFINGVEAAFRLDATLSAVGFLIALLLVGGRLRLRGSPVPQPASGSASVSGSGSS